MEILLSRLLRNFFVRLLLLPALAFLLAEYLSRRPKLLKLVTYCEASLVILAAVFLTIRLTAPLAYHMTDHVAWGILDNRYLAYVQAWDVHALRTNPARLFDANFFFPTKTTLACSENLLGNMPIFAPIYMLTGNAILASNVVLLATFFLSAISMYLLVRAWVGDPWAAAVAGFVYAFAPARIYQMERVHIISMQWCPLIILLLLRFLRSGSVGNLVAFSALMIVQVLCSLQAGSFTIVVVITFLITQLVLHPESRNRRVIIGLFVSCLVIGSILLPVAIPYLKLQKQGVLSTFLHPEEVSAVASNYLNAGRDSVHEGDFLRRFRAPKQDHEKRLFFGLLPLGLGLAAIAGNLGGKLRSAWRSESPAKPTRQSAEAVTPDTDLFLGSMLTVLFGFVLSLGPYLYLGATRPVRLPYYWLSKLIPGFSAIRTPSRFGFVVLFGVAVLAALCFRTLLRIVQRTWSKKYVGITAALTSVLILAMFWEFKIDVFAIPVPATAGPEYSWLARQAPGSVTLELPTQYWDARWSFARMEHEAGYLYISTYHWQPLMNGFSGHIPPISFEILRTATQLPAADAVSVLAKYGLRFVVVHVAEMTIEEKAAWQRLPEKSGLQRVAKFNDTVIYELQSALQGGSLRDAMPSIASSAAPPARKILWTVGLNSTHNFQLEKDMLAWIGKQAPVMSTAVHTTVVTSGAGDGTTFGDGIANATSIWNLNMVPFLNFGNLPGCVYNSCTTTNPDQMIANGCCDTYLNAAAVALKNWLAGPDGIYGTADDRRLYLAMYIEVGGSWEPFSPGYFGNTVASYIAMWRHIVAIFRTNNGLDANHVQFVWVPWPSAGGTATYPGDAYVDWVGADAFADGGMSVSQTLDSDISAIRAVAPSKPFTITQTGIVKSTVPLKANWIATLFGSYAQANNLKMIIWWNMWEGPGTGNDFILFGCDNNYYPDGLGCYGTTTFDWNVQAATNLTGDGTAVINGTHYLFYNEYKTAVTGANYVAADPTNPRLLTDAQFQGNE